MTSSNSSDTSDADTGSTSSQTPIASGDPESGSCDNNGDEKRRSSRPRRRRRSSSRKRSGDDSGAGEQSRSDQDVAERAVDAPHETVESAVQADIWDPASFTVDEDPDKVRFHDLDLPEQIMHAVADLGFQYCTPIQAEILPKTLTGNDAAGRAQTGTGKTAAFLISVFTRLMRTAPSSENRAMGRPRAVVLAPTRELAIQIEKDGLALSKYTTLNVLAVFGGMHYEKQKRRLENEAVDVVIATPGRLLDFRRKRCLDLRGVEILVIDEADRMLDMGFIPDVRSIVYSTPHKDKRQTMLFSATLTSQITLLCAQWTNEPVTVEIDPGQVTVDTVDQIVYITTTDDKFTLLYNLVTRNDLTSVMVFGNRRDNTRNLADRLDRYGISSALLSGDIPQAKRIKTLERFRSGDIRVLVATDVASRGLHVDNVSHVVNYNLPYDAEDYVHRIGRTGRAGATGTSISFACEEDSYAIPEIESYIGHDLVCTHPDETLLEPLPAPLRERKPRSTVPRTRSGGGRRPGGDRRSGGGRRPGSGGGRRSTGGPRRSGGASRHR